MTEPIPTSQFCGSAKYSSGTSHCCFFCASILQADLLEWTVAERRRKNTPLTWDDLRDGIKTAIKEFPWRYPSREPDPWRDNKDFATVHKQKLSEKQLETARSLGCSFALFLIRLRPQAIGGLKLLSQEELDRVYEEDRIHLEWDLILGLNGSQHNNFQLELIMSAAVYEKYKTFYVLPHPDCEAGSGISVARDINPDPAAKWALGMARRWIWECYYHRNGSHERCPKRPSFSSNAFMPQRVLQIFGSSPQEGIRLVESSDIKKDREYTALSYKWGERSQPLLCTKATIAGLKHGFDFFELPATIQDALIVTFELEMRHCWVDALCIVQDDEADRGAQLEKMPIIYSEANVTIGASRADGATSGFLGPRLATLPGFDIEYRHYTDTGQSIIPRHPGPGKCWKAVLVDPDVIDPLRGDDFLASRGWCLQERMLSPRFLDFRPLQTVYQCNEVFLDYHKSHYTDGWVPPDLDGVSSIYRDKTGELEWKKQRILHRAAIVLAGWDYTSRLVSGEVRKPGRWYQRVIDAVGSTKPLRKPTDKELADAWYAILLDYTSRDLSQTTDRLNAISAVAFAYNAHTNDQYYAGIWGKLLPGALLWQLVSESPVKARAEKYSGPTWSWSAVGGGVKVAPDLRDAIATEIGGRDSIFKDARAYRRDLGTPISFAIEPLRKGVKYGEVKQNACMTVRGHIIPVRWCSHESGDLSGLQQSDTHRFGVGGTTTKLPMFPQFSVFPPPRFSISHLRPPSQVLEGFRPTVPHLTARVHGPVSSVIMADVYLDVEMPCTSSLLDQGSDDLGTDLFLLPMQEFHPRHSLGKHSMIHLFTPDTIKDGGEYPIFPPRESLPVVERRLKALPDWEFGSQPVSIIRGIILVHKSQSVFERVGLFEHKPFPAMAADRDRQDRPWCMEYYLQWFWLHEMLAAKPLSIVIV